eukprot:UN08195
MQKLQLLNQYKILLLHFTTVACPSAACSAKNSFVERLVDFIAQKTGYNKQYIKYDLELSKWNTTTLVLSNLFNLLVMP